MGYYIIIRGSAGVGKTTISNLLAKKIKAEIISFDKIMKSLGADYVPGDKWIPLEAFLKAHEIELPNLKEKLQNGINLIIDHNFYHKEQIEDLIKSLGFQHFVFTLKADLNECIRRDKTRKGELGKEATKSVFKLVSAFNYGIDIDTNEKTPAEIVDEILHHLPKPNK